MKTSKDAPQENKQISLDLKEISLNLKNYETYRYHATFFTPFDPLLWYNELKKKEDSLKQPSSSNARKEKKSDSAFSPNKLSSSGNPTEEKKSDLPSPKIITVNSDQEKKASSKKDQADQIFSAESDTDSVRTEKTDSSGKTRSKQEKEEKSISLIIRMK